ncbi:hypothetical protein BC940DRAFT_292786 [Gongronella butleri]|nr:hypothetical protein BC940DRAFT_292786 [Gongronella butleri]
MIMSSQKRHFILLGTFFIFLLTISYHQYTTTRAESLHDRLYERPVEPAAPTLPVNTPTDNDTELEKPCDKANIMWLASDRTNWNGWDTKTFFLHPDGNYSASDLYVPQHTSLCVVVLLGPVPAVSKIKVENHYAPSDIITMTAVGTDYSIAVTLEQHAKQNNAYFANVYLRHPDTYELRAVTEYRSFFWETPIHHNYQPYGFVSDNKVVVQPATPANAADTALHTAACTGNTLRGSWFNNSDVYEFSADRCDLRFTRQDALRCLHRKTVHVWGDGNMRRSLKVMADPQWCTEHPTILGLEEDDPSICICNDDMDDPEHTLFPWAADHRVPLTLGDNTVHYNSIGAITTQDWRGEIAQRASGQLPRADLVILSVGNEDVASSRLKPVQFARAFADLLKHLVENVYPTQTILVRTPQFFGSGTHYWTAWNAGRSRAFANVVRDTLAQWQHPRLHLWDTHQFGLEYNTCRYQGTLYTRRNVIDMENQHLYQLMCAPNS